jgi:uncharacterized protein YcbK (DUF882 family)
MNYFTKEELSCQHCGDYKFNEEFLKILNNIRHECNFPFVVSSGYRCIEHPIEASKLRGGAHTTGSAVDIAVTGDKALKVLEVALAQGIKRIGINQKGNGRFIHLDMADDEFPSPAIWSY